MPEVNASQVSSLVENTEYLTWDVLGILGIVAVVFLYSFTIGKDYVVPLLFTLYIAGFIMLVVPYIDMITAMIEAQAWLAQIIVFAAIFLLVFFILKSNGFFEPYVVPTGFEVGTFSLVMAGLLVMIIGTFLTQDVIGTFSPLTRMIFFGDIAVTAWPLAPVAALLLIRGET